ncbi:DUF6597 domain-containing transcriptional factor [Phyllobacterium zundukense]|uniref:DUF6597 domain-containing protein n=1 Tax=Phyllobacterium zundukense TaxID=1867719 RepID=A0A2N9VRS8_9HYPH|nr:hypothetical protein B5P45_24505 [Phyllobacterium zundukense]
MRPDNKPVLANCSGHYCESLPIVDLRSHFLCAWSRNGLGSRPVTVVPDGCVDLLWAQGRVTVAGPDIGPQLVDPAMTSIIGMRFAPGAAAHWLGLPMSELVNRRIDLRELWGTRADALADSLSATRSDEEAASSFEACLARIARTVASPDTAMALAFRRLANVNQDSGVASLSDELNISERTLRRRCHYYYGYGPKVLERILRFQKFLTLVR